jgi:hypothetical protein
MQKDEVTSATFTSSKFLPGWMDRVVDVEDFSRTSDQLNSFDLPDFNRPLRHRDRATSEHIRFARLPHERGQHGLRSETLE